MSFLESCADNVFAFFVFLWHGPLPGTLDIRTVPELVFVFPCIFSDNRSVCKKTDAVVVVAERSDADTTTAADNRSKSQKFGKAETVGESDRRSIIAKPPVSPRRMKPRLTGWRPRPPTIGPPACANPPPSHAAFAAVDPSAERPSIASHRVNDFQRRVDTNAPVGDVFLKLLLVTSTTLRTIGSRSRFVNG
jgi:hypothetical protein